MQYLKFDFEVKKKAAGTYIEGLSNANVKDRMKERIKPDAWLLENYKKNPVVLFDHGKDPAFGNMPVGKSVEVGPTDSGLYTKIMLSNSKTEKLTAIRDLVEEGILKTFSVGFNPLENEKDGNDPDGILITKAELIEQSIVPIPMNQDSLFGLASKRFHTDNPTAKKWFDAHSTRIALGKKGAWFAAALHQRLYDMMETGEIGDRSKALKAVADEAGVSTQEINKVLDGSTTPVPAKIVAAFAKMLRLDKDFLVNLDQGDIALLERVHYNQQGGKGMAAKKTKGDMPKEGDKQPVDGQKPADDAGKKADGPDMVLYQVIIPKTVADSVESAVAMAEDAGYAADKVEETDEAFVLTQAPAEGLDLQNAQQQDLGNGVVAVMASKVSPPASDQQGQDNAKGADAQNADGQKPADGNKPADGQAADGEGDQQPVDEQAAKDAYAKFQEERKATNEGGPGNPASWIADEEKWNKAKKMAEAAGADDVYAFAVWAYLNVLDGKKKGAKGFENPITKNIEGTDDNPYLKAAGQTNVLLGTLINEIQTMSGKLDGIATLSVNLAKLNGEQGKDKLPPKEGDGSADGSGDNSKSLDLLASFRRDFSDIDTRLKRLNV